MTIYRNYEVFSEPVDASDANSETRSAKLSVVSSAVGARRVYDSRGFPVRKTDVTLVAVGAQALAALRAFIRRRKGRVVPFWMPTGLSDLVVLNDEIAGSTHINFKTSAYTGVFASGARSHLSINGDATQVLAAVSGTGSTTVTLASGLLKPLTAGTPISYLLLYRLSADETVIDFEGADFASASLQLIELPNET